MTRSSITVALVFTALGLTALPLAAQVDTSKAIPIKTLKPPKTKTEKFRGEVMYMTAVAITVRGLESPMTIRTFTYSPKVRGRMQKILDRGGYQYGDKVTIECQAGSEVALRVKGKPSKPL